MLILGWQLNASQPEFPGINGFLGARGSFMLDVVFLAMFLVIPVLFYSIGIVKKQGKYNLHKWIQLVLGIVLLLAVTAFEVDMRLNDWKPRALPSPYYNEGQWCAVWYSLVIHLSFAIPTLFLWIAVILRALWQFPSPPTPGLHSKAHKFWGWLAALGMAGTAFTGWIFYYLAFVAT